MNWFIAFMIASAIVLPILWYTFIMVLRRIFSGWALCFHKFKSGGGAMGDALTCSKCDLSKYPEKVDWEFRLGSKLQGGDW